MAEATPQSPPLPNQQQIDDASELCSELHHSYYARPPVSNKDARMRWYKFYVNAIFSLSTLLRDCNFTDLPMVVVASIYRTNVRAKTKTEFIDFEPVHPDGAAHPDVEPPPGCRRLPYNPTDTGQVPVKPVEQVKKKWWLSKGKPAQATALPAVAEQAAVPATAAQPQAGSSASGNRGVSKPSSQAKPLKSALKSPSVRDRDRSVPRPQVLAEETSEATGSNSKSMHPRGLAPNKKGKARVTEDDPMDVDDDGRRPAEQSDKKRKRLLSGSVPPSSQEMMERGRTLEKSTTSRQQTRSNSVAVSPVRDDAPKRKKTKTEPFVPPEDDFPPEDIPNTYMEQLAVCAKCAAADGICVFWPFGSSVCHRCASASSKCTNTVGANNTKKPIPTYLQWRYQKQLADPARFPNPTCVPPEWAGFHKDPPTWFVERWRQYKKSKPDPPDYGALLAARKAGDRRQPSALAEAAPPKTVPSKTVSPKTIPPKTLPPKTLPPTTADASLHPASLRFGPDTDDKGYTEISDDEPVLQGGPIKQGAPSGSKSADNVVDLTAEDRPQAAGDSSASGDASAGGQLEVRQPPAVGTTEEGNTSNSHRTQTGKPLQSIQVPQAPATAPGAAGGSANDGTATTAKQTRKEQIRAREQCLIPVPVKSWHELPALARPPSPTLGGPAAGPHMDFRPENLAEYVALRLAQSSDGRIGELSAEVPVPPSISRPATPPSQVFTLGPATRQLLYDSQRKAWSASQIKDAVTFVGDNLRGLMTRLDARQASLATVCYAESSVQAMNEIMGTAAGLVDDNKAIAIALCAVADIGHLLARSLEGVAAISPQFGAVSELAEILAQLRALYGEVQEKFTMTRDYVNTLSTAVLELQEKAPLDNTTVRALAGMCSNAVEPMLKSLHYNLKKEIDTIRDTIAPLQCAVTTLESRNLPPAQGELRDGALAPLQPTVLADDVRSHDESSTTADSRTSDKGLASVLETIRQRLTALEDLQILKQNPAGTSLPPSSVLHTSASVAHTDGAVAATEDLHTTVADLSARIDRLETAQQTPDPATFNKQVQQYLDSVGLPASLLTVMSQLVGAHMDPQGGDSAEATSLPSQ
ncbi:hypothetical protein C8T65DRAFT_746922 [Cerioporus squamosus]|nr:hypothetical protein C8T65DRAFT_746922 [Cerioporus squamosus]